MKTLTLLFFNLVASTLAQYSNYEGYKIYEIYIRDTYQARGLDVLRSNANYDFLSETQTFNHPINIMVTSDAQEEFLSVIKRYNIEYYTAVESIESVINAEHQRMERAPNIQKGRMSFTEFQRYDVIEEYLDELFLEYADIVTVETFGYSLEGRPLKLIRIGSGSSHNPTILIDGGIHAREWIAPAVTTYIIQQLVENVDNRELIENINWIIVPVLNPDGYEYTFTNERLWRKTRRPGISCYGVDANRNFGYHWSGNGTSDDECSEIYVGPYAFSEPEVAAFAEIALATNSLVLYLGIHSYGNYLLYPWGWTADPVENADELQQLGESVADAIEAVNGTSYTAGSSVELLYYASGSSKDWAASIGVPLSYTIELPAGDTGSSGFIVPAERIIPICEETWPGIVTFANYVANRSRKG